MVDMPTNEVAIVGNAVRAPELRFLASGTAVCDLAIAHNYKRGDEERVSFFDVTAFSSLAENVAESIDKGDRIIVSGRLELQSWETSEGEKRSKVVIIAECVGVELRFASATIQRNEKQS